jgi:tRNA pseudouridine13 synthase
MADIHPDTTSRPQKRQRIDESTSTSTSTSAPTPPSIATTPTPVPSHAAQATPSNPPIARPTSTAHTVDADLEREVRAGITEYVSPDNLGFTGVLKQRYTDFLVNEIGLDGRVVRLVSTGVRKKGKGEMGKDEKNGEGGEEVGKDVAKEEDKNVEMKSVTDATTSNVATIEKVEDVDMKNTNGGAVKEEAVATNGKTEEKPTEEKPDDPVSEKDLAELHALFGEDVTAQIISLARAISKRPDRKAKDFTAVTTAPIPDKEDRGQAHQLLRRTFPGLLESSMEDDQSLRIKAQPPADRGNKRKRGNDREPGQGPDRRKGQLAWEELGGEYLHFTLYKENKDTMEVVGFLGSQTGGGPKSYSFAGTKDRRACTVQRVCVKRQTAERMAGLGKRLFNGAIGDYEYKNHDLRLGDLLGNEFTITLRNCRFEKEEGLDHAQRMELANEVLSQAVKDFSERGFINYYGLQRFGSFSASTDAVGIKLLQDDLQGAVQDLLAYSDAALFAAEHPDENTGVLVSQDDRARAKALHIWKTEQNGNEALKILPKKFSAERNIIQHLSSKNSRTKQHDRRQDWQGALMTIPRNLRLMYVHAYQSLVWNVVAGKRWSLHGDKVVEGDLVLVHEHTDKEARDTAPILQDTVDQDGEAIINPQGANSTNADDDAFERARPLSKLEAESGKYSIFDVVLPQPGYDVEYPRNAIGAFYKEFMSSERGGGLDPHNMRRKWREVSLSGGYRKFLARPLQPMSFEIKEYTKEDKQLVETDLERLQKQKWFNGRVRAESKKEEGEGEMEVVGQEKIAVVVRFQLASSQYATVALRELMKAGGVKAFKPEFMGGR